MLVSRDDATRCLLDEKCGSRGRPPGGRAKPVSRDLWVRRNPVLWSRATAAWLAREGRAYPAGLERTAACERCSLRLPEVVTWADAPVPHAGPGQIRIAVRAASVNPV